MSCLMMNTTSPKFFKFVRIVLFCRFPSQLCCHLISYPGNVYLHVPHVRKLKSAPIVDYRGDVHTTENQPPELSYGSPISTPVEFDICQFSSPPPYLLDRGH